MLSSLTLAQLFGDGASQDTQSLIIQKAGLNLLTPSPNNRGEQLLTAILVKALENFQGIISAENYDSINDEFNNFIIDEINNEISFLSGVGEGLTDEFGELIAFNNIDAYEFLSVFLFSKYFSERNGQLFTTNQLVIHGYEQTD